MSIFWLQPAAAWGVLALVIPVLIHLLVRQPSRRLLFPSLKFLHPTRLAAWRRRTISDWLLLLVRVAILAIAVAAFAAPVFVSAGRRQLWSQRVARAIVVTHPMGQTSNPGDQLARISADERARAFASAVFTASGHLADALRAASDWLERQPPSSREIVITGDLRDGSLLGVDVARVPSAIGIRFLPLSPTLVERRAQLGAIAESQGTTTVQQLQLLLGDNDTTVDYRPDPTAAAPIPIEVRASPEHQPRVEAALRAVVAEGVLLHRDGTRRLTIEFDGAPKLERRALMQPAAQSWMRHVLEQLPEVRGGEADGRLIVGAGMTGGDPRTLHLLADVVRTAFADDLRDLEPRLLPASTLAGWSRPPGPLPDEMRPGDEGDRRYLWIAALLLLAVEQWIRRSIRSARPQADAGQDVEVRVA